MAVFISYSKAIGSTVTTYPSTFVLECDNAELKSYLESIGVEFGSRSTSEAYINTIICRSGRSYCDMKHEYGDDISVRILTDLKCINGVPVLNCMYASDGDYLFVHSSSDIESSFSPVYSGGY